MKAKLRIIVTGTPGTGKTSIAKALGQKLKAAVINEREFALKKGLGELKGEELVVPLKPLEAALNKELVKRKRVIMEGHLLCELKLKAELVLVLTVEPEVLEQRLRKRKYSEEKIQENVMCEGIEYCKKHALKKYGKRKVLVVGAGETIKETLSNIINELGKRVEK